MPYLNGIEPTWVRQSRLRKERMDAWLLARDSSLPLSQALTLAGRKADEMEMWHEDLYSFGDPGIPGKEVRRMFSAQVEPFYLRLRDMGYPSLDYLYRHAELRTSPKVVHSRFPYLSSLFPMD